MAHLGGVSEVADLIGVSRQRFAELRDRPDFPEPVAELASGPIWDMSEVERWANSGVRRAPGRQPKSTRVVGERFVLEGEPLGSGGFADVYRAVDRRTGDVVAVKILKDVNDIDDEAVIRFRRELRLMEESLDHPHVAKVLAHGDFGDVDQIWCAMPLAVGSLQDEIAEMKDNVGAVVDLARQLCAGIGYVHAQGVLHRDLKPGNILRDVDGRWVISDFGLAREDERKSLALTTTLAAGMGTYFYASPDQWARPKHADKRDDVFSVGKILQHAMTGEIPMVPADRMPESALRPVIQRATGPRENRYREMEHLLAAIEQAVDAYSQVWEAPEDKLTRLRSRVSAPVVDTVAAEEVLEWVCTVDDGDLDNAAQALVASSLPAIQHMWSANPVAVRAAVLRLSKWMQTYGQPFGYCDSIANSARTIYGVTQDNDVLRSLVAGLTALGAGHNRWHVRDVLVGILQAIRNQEQAVVALEGLQAVSASSVDWSIQEFAERSLHPVLRQGVMDIRASIGTAS